MPVVRCQVRFRFPLLLLLLGLLSIPYSAGLAQGPRVVSPNGGEQLDGGSIVTIQWSGIVDSETDSVTIEYSTDGGTAWETVVERIGGNSFDWSVPPIATEAARLRLRQVTGTFETVDTLHHFYRVGEVTEAYSKVRFSRDGTILAVTGGKELQLRRMPSGEVIWKHRFDLETNQRPALHPTKPWIAMALRGRSNVRVEVWDYQSDRLLYAVPVQGTVQAIYDAEFSTDGRHLAVGAFLGSGIHDATTGALVSRLPIDTVVDIEYRPGHQQFVTGDAGGNVVLWNAKSVAPIRTITVSSAPRFGFDGSGARLVTDGDSARVWDIETGELVNSVGLPSSNSTLARVRNGGTVVALFRYHEVFIEIRDVATRRLLGTIRPRISYSSDVDLHPTEPIVAMGQLNGDILVFSTERRDESDGDFAIVSPVTQVPIVQFGSVRLGESRDSVIEGYVENRGTDPVAIESLVITGDAAAEFTLLEGLGAGTLGAGERRRAAIRFRPAGLGARAATIEVRTTSATYTGEVRGVGIEGTTGISVDDRSADESSARSYGAERRLEAVMTPNPADREIQIELRLPEPTSVDITVSDLSGRTVLSHTESHAPAGTLRLSYDVSSVPAGTYVVSAEAAGLTTSFVLVVQR